MSKNAKKAQDVGCEEHCEGGGDGGEDEDLAGKLGVAIHFLRHRHGGNREGRCKKGDENGEMRGFEATEQKRDAESNDGGEEVARANAEDDLLFQGGDGRELKVCAEAEERHGGGDRGEVGEHLVNGLDIRQSEGDARLHENIADAEKRAAGGNAEDQGVLENAEEACAEKLQPIDEKKAALESRRKALYDARNGKKEDEVLQSEKDELFEVEKEITAAKSEKEAVLAEYAAENSTVKQLIDITLLQNNMLSGEALNNFVKRSIELMK